jgi:hypothetical protein
MLLFNDNKTNDRITKVIHESTGIQGINTIKDDVIAKINTGRRFFFLALGTNEKNQITIKPTAAVLEFTGLEDKPESVVIS